MSGLRQTTIENRLDVFIEIGVLPSKNISTFSEIQKSIYNDISTSRLSKERLIYKYLDYANITSKRFYIHKKIHNKQESFYYKNKGYAFDILPEDIIMNDYCPFFGTKLIYSSEMGKENGGSLRNPFLYSVDRIDNSKGYIKGNVWIISRLANSMKLDSNINELKKFCKNVILMHIKNV